MPQPFQNVVGAFLYSWKKRKNKKQVKLNTKIKQFEKNREFYWKNLFMKEKFKKIGQKFESLAKKVYKIKEFQRKYFALLRKWNARIRVNKVTHK